MELDASSREYIDCDDALKRIGGNEGLYKKLLARFVSGNYLDVLCDALERGDAEESARQAHTLKGVSANLSLVKVKDAATELEHFIKAGTDHSAKLEELKLAYNITLEKVAAIV